MIWIKSGTSSEVDYGRTMQKKDFDRKQHWDNVYGGKPAQLNSWYQAVPGISLSMIANSGLGHDASLIDIGGGASLLVDHLLDLGYRDLTVLDVSRAAMAQARERLARRASLVHWIEADVTRHAPDRLFDLWHDRAAFHFLTAKADRSRYVMALRNSLAPEGQAIISTFAPSGPAQCSGLDIVRYDGTQLSEQLGPEFSLEEQEEESHLTPAKREQAFNYFRFRRRL
jgi:SAM-dependent methyltransferase